MRKNVIIDDGFNHELVVGANFDGILEIPCLERPRSLVVPDSLIPFSKRNQTSAYSEFLIFYEHDVNFSGILIDPEAYLPIVSKFSGMVTLDCSLYTDTPLTEQISNTYRNRAVGYYFQKRGVYVIPNVRWGDERSYTTEYLPEAFAFLGVPKHSIVSIGTYGCIRGKENQYQFKHGLEAMLETLSPKIVLVYGAMPDSVFSDFLNKTRFVQYPDWISTRKRRG